MTTEKWLKTYENRLSGKRVALFGPTGGIGQVLARYILRLSGALVLVGRSEQKISALREKLLDEYKDADIASVICDLEDIDSVRASITELKALGIDILVHNAGAYSIPRKICKNGIDNVFQINFLSPYIITASLLPRIERVVAVGSIAHNYSKTDKDDIDFRTRTRASLAYGNAKRYLMYSLFELAKVYPDTKLSVVHPGITFTNITAHYPKLVFAIIKHPMKIIFMKPHRAALSVLKGLFDDTPSYSWIGPRFFDVWGLPKRRVLKTADAKEISFINETATRLFCEYSQAL